MRAVVGISLGGTSEQGLTLLRELADEAYVLHHPGRTFHPKVYAASGQSHAAVFVGSNNLTLGGVSRNYEAGVLAELDLTVEGDSSFLAEIAAWVERLIEDEATTRPLTAAFLRELVANRRYPLADADAPGGTSEPVETTQPDERDSNIAEEESGRRMFGASRHAMRNAPRTRGQTAASRPAAGAAPATTSRAPAAARATAAGVLRRWFKRLPAADAQQLVGSHPSHTMTLVMAGHPINAATYFREVFFREESWVRSETRGGAQPREIATIQCDVVVHGNDLGTWVFEIRHTPGYDADQVNRTTELAWGDFAPYLQEHSFTGDYATLEKTSSGYRLTIAGGPTGPFAY